MYNIRAHVLTDIASRFGVDPRVVVDLIYQECKYNPSVGSECIGLMQVSVKDGPVSSMLANPSAYCTYFSQIPDSTIQMAKPERLGTLLGRLRDLASHGIESSSQKAEYRKIISDLGKDVNRRNSYVNVVLGCAYLARMQDNAEKAVGSEAKSAETRSSTTEKLAKEVGKMSLEFINSERAAIGKAPLSQSDIQQAANSIRTDPAYAAQYLSVVNYNGNTQTLPKGVQRRYYYGLIVSMP